MSSPADETRDASERRFGRCEPPAPLSKRYITYDEVEVTDAYIKDAIGAAENHADGSGLGSEERDLVDFVYTLAQEVYRQRNRVAFLEGWKEATEAAVEHVKRA